MAFLPWMSKKFRTNITFLGILNSFGGGIFLAGGLIHILPEALLKMNEYYEGGHDDHRILRMLEEEEKKETDNFPWPTFAACLIFVFQLALEKTIVKDLHASFLFAFGMGLHAVFAGLALGLEKEASGFIAILIGILAHKFSEAVAVGLKFFDNISPGKLNKEKDEEENSKTEKHPVKKIKSVFYEQSKKDNGQNINNLVKNNENNN